MNRREFVASTALSVTGGAMASADLVYVAPQPLEFGPHLLVVIDGPDGQGNWVEGLRVSGSKVREFFWHYMDAHLPDWRRQVKMAGNHQLREDVQLAMRGAADNRLILPHRFRTTVHAISRTICYEGCGVMVARYRMDFEGRSRRPWEHDFLPETEDRVMQVDSDVGTKFAECNRLLYQRRNFGLSVMRVVFAEDFSVYRVRGATDDIRVFADYLAAHVMSRFRVLNQDPVHGVDPLIKRRVVEMKYIAQLEIDQAAHDGNIVFHARDAVGIGGVESAISKCQESGIAITRMQEDLQRTC